MSAQLKLKDIAARISAHLARLAASNDTNPVSANGFRKFHFPRAWQGSVYVRVCYVSYQLAHSLTRAEAEQYLDALDTGFTDRHNRLPKEAP